MPLLRLMLNRAPKLTARTFYAPLNERSSFDGLRETARLIGNDVRRRMFIIYVGLHRKPVLTEGRRLSLSVRPTRSGDSHPQVDIINLKDGVFLLFSSLRI